MLEQTIFLNKKEVREDKEIENYRVNIKIKKYKQFQFQENGSSIMEMQLQAKKNKVIKQKDLFHENTTILYMHYDMVIRLE